jgi:hypothetical protein
VLLCMMLPLRRFCVFPESVVPECLNAVALANGNGTTFTCVGAPTANECLAKIAISREADITKVGGTCFRLESSLEVANGHYNFRTQLPVLQLLHCHIISVLS